MAKALVRGGAYVAALAVCNLIARGSVPALLGLFIVAAAGIELLLPVVAVERCPAVRSVAGLHFPRLSTNRVAGLWATTACMVGAGVALVFSALKVSGQH